MNRTLLCGLVALLAGCLPPAIQSTSDLALTDPVKQDLGAIEPGVDLGIKDAEVTTDASSAPDASDPLAHPPLESSLRLWLDPGYMVTADGSGNVSAWADRSAAGTMTTVSSVGVQQVANAIGTRPAVLFDPVGVGSRVSGKFVTALADRPVTIVFVAKVPLSGEAQLSLFQSNDGFLFLSKKADDTPELLLQGGGVADFRLAPTVTALSSQARVYTFRRKDAALEFRVDGISAKGVAPRGTYVINQYLNFAPGLTGDIMVYDADLSDADLLSVESFLKTKYGL